MRLTTLSYVAAKNEWSYTSTSLMPSWCGQRHSFFVTRVEDEENSLYQLQQQEADASET
jgi:hypothetical protein